MVASIRCYQIAGPRNIHLYLYGLDGTLKKQLTNKVGCDDVDAAFTFDGKSICFMRKSTISDTVRDEGLYQLDLATGTATRQDKNEAYVNVPMDELHYGFAVPASSWNVSDGNDSVSPDGLYRITLKPLPAPDSRINPPMQHFLFIRGGSAVNVMTLADFRLRKPRITVGSNSSTAYRLSSRKILLPCSSCIISTALTGTRFGGLTFIQKSGSR